MTSCEPAAARRDYLAAIVPFALSAALAAACYAAAGPSLGLYFGAALLATVVAPPLVLAEPTWVRRAFAGAAVGDGTAVVWLVAAVRTNTTLYEWLACYVVLTAYVLAVAGVALALRRLRVNAFVASAVATVAGLAWLTWPVWLSPWLAGDRGATVAAWLAPAHPLLAMNGILLHLGAWGEQQIAYHLTNLGQDVPYRLPTTVLPAVVVHAIVGAAGVALAASGRTGREDVDGVSPTSPAP